MTSPPIPTILSRHAEDMLVERRLEREWIEKTIAEPEELEHDPRRPGVLRAFRRIPERGNRVLRVVYVSAQQHVRVVTAFFDRGRR